MAVSKYLRFLVSKEYFQEFAFVTSKMALKEGGFGTYTDHDQKEILASKSSGLVNFIYGKDRKGSLNK